jgi:hypothetical protein
MTLLSKNNTKLLKSKKLGYVSYGLSLSPHKVSGKNFCSHASKGCAAACLSTAGMGIFSNVQAGRLKKSKEFINNRKGFLEQLDKELTILNKRAEKGEKISVRLNVLSDLPFENLIDMNKYSSLNFMDYTKNPLRMFKFTSGLMPKNYHLTFSRSESNELEAFNVLSNGGNVAVVFNKLPKAWKGFNVVDGDETDLRFLDKKNCVVGLIAKGRGKKDKSGFIVNV